MKHRKACVSYNIRVGTISSSFTSDWTRKWHDNYSFLPITILLQCKVTNANAIYFQLTHVFVSCPILMTELGPLVEPMV